jgi:hypothetical protein
MAGRAVDPGTIQLEDPAKDLIYAQQGTKAMYTNIEFGITANTRENEMTVYLDDINVETLP